MLNFLSLIFSCIVALEHVYICYMETVLWQKTKIRKLFNLTEDEAKTTAPMAKNMGLYNLFIGLGLFYSIYLGITEIEIFFLFCVLVAAVVGGVFLLL
eukprot:gene5358-9166_t